MDGILWQPRGVIASINIHKNQVELQLRATPQMRLRPVLNSILKQAKVKE
jgi:tRNA threonylcarbamoyladenosine modification (KEOPS) complex  Pcc1 subunit